MQKVTTEYKKRAITKFLESFLELPNSQSVCIDRTLASSVLECLNTDTKEDVKDNTVCRVIIRKKKDSDFLPIITSVFTDDFTVIKTIPSIQYMQLSSPKGVLCATSIIPFGCGENTATIYSFLDKKALAVGANNNTFTMYDISNIADLYVKSNMHFLTEEMKESFRNKFNTAIKDYARTGDLKIEAGLGSIRALNNLVLAACMNFTQTGLYSALS